MGVRCVRRIILWGGRWCFKVGRREWGGGGGGEENNPPTQVTQEFYSFGRGGVGNERGAGLLGFGGKWHLPE